MIQDLLGHSSISVTERFYLKRRQRAAGRGAARPFGEKSQIRFWYMVWYMRRNSRLRKAILSGKLLRTKDAPVAQLDRAFDYDSQGFMCGNSLPVTSA